MTHACSKLKSLKCPPVLNEKGTAMDTSSLYQAFFVGWEKTAVMLVFVHFARLIVSVNLRTPKMYLYKNFLLLPFPFL